MSWHGLHKGWNTRPIEDDLRAKVERLTVNLKLCKDDSAEMDRRRIARIHYCVPKSKACKLTLLRKPQRRTDYGKSLSGWLVRAEKLQKRRLSYAKAWKRNLNLSKVTSERISPSAQKVERLTRSNERFGLVHGEFMEKLHCQDKKIDTLTAERDRMKAALEKLTDHRTNHILNIKQVQDIARAALMAVQE